MGKKSLFSGSIHFYPVFPSNLNKFHSKKKLKKKLINYETPTEAQDFTEIIMSSFHFLSLNKGEKKMLSGAHREMINQYRNLNLLLLSDDARRFIETLKIIHHEHLIIEAEGYGAYICLAALYSGHFPFNKKIEFKFSSSPLALFPKAMIRSMPIVREVKINFSVEEDSWLKPFATLYTNEKILYKLTG